MSIFDWQDAYSVDNGMIDRQHKKLLLIAEKLFNAVISEQDETVLKECFDELMAYTQKHFKDEDAFFEQSGVTDLAHHRQEHAALAQELQDVWQKETMGFSGDHGRILLNWVEERLLPHMMIDDQETYSQI